MKKDLYAFTRALRSMTTSMSNSSSKWCSNECKLTLQFDNLSMAANMADNTANAQNNNRKLWPAINNNNNNKQQNPSGKRRTSSIDTIKDSVKVIKLTKNVLKATNNN